MDRDRSDWQVRQRAVSHPDAAALIEEVQQEYVARYGNRDETPMVPGYFDTPQGAFYVGYLDGAPVATGAWHLRTDVTALGRRASAEIKRMYVAPAGRRRGLARLILAHLEVTARAAGADLMILETGSEQPEALGLYVSAGYQPIPGFGYYRDSPLNRCMARRLD